jgi:hypothetical protein
MKTGKCQYSYPEESVHKNSGWKTKRVPSKPYDIPIPRTVEHELGEADDRNREEERKRKVEEVTARIRELLKDILTEEQLKLIAVLRRDDPVVGIPASILFIILDKHTEVIEELRQIIDGLS